MISPDPIHACWEVSNGFCVAGATISMPLRCSPLTLYMLVGKCQMAFVWQVQQFPCLWDVLPWPYTCIVGKGQMAFVWQVQQFSMPLRWFPPDPIHACWEGSNGFCVAGATIVMPLRWSPLTLYMLVGKCQMAFCVAGATISMPLRCSPVTLYMLVGKCQMAFVWQVQQFWCLWDDLPWPYTCLLGSVKWLLCGRCNNFDASEMFSPDPIHACWEGSNGFLCGRCSNFDASEMISPKMEGQRHFSVILLDYIGVDAHHFTGLPWCRCFFPCIMISGWKIAYEFLPTEQGFLSRAMPFFLFRVKWSVCCVVWPYLWTALYMDQKVGRSPVVTWIIESMGCRGGGKFW